MNNEIKESGFVNHRREKIISPWVTLVTHTVSTPDHPAPREFHGLKLADYVAVLAVTADGRIPLVRQYRPILDEFTLELPAGLLEAQESPAECARRELAEETGYAVDRDPVPLGCMSTDTGRLENRLWSFVATGVVPISGHTREHGVEAIVVTRAELLEAIRTGRFSHALHLAVIAQAIARDSFSLAA